MSKKENKIKYKYPSEEQEHFAVCDYLKKVYPDVIFLSAGDNLLGFIPHLAAKFAELKSSRGIPDIIILEPKFGFHGLIIEMKKQDISIYQKRNPTEYMNEHISEQASVLERLYFKYYYACFALGAEAAINTINMYITNSVV